MSNHMKKRTLVRAVVFFMVSAALIVTATNVVSAEDDQLGELPLPPPGEGKIAGIGGSGTLNYIPKFVGSTTLGNSVLYELGGNVGIGTTQPSARLDIVPVNNIGLRLGGADQGALIEYARNSGAYNFYTGVPNSIDSVWQIQNNERNPIFTANYNGNVGIGTTNPGGKLEIYDANGPVARLMRSGTNFGVSFKVRGSAENNEYLDIGATHDTGVPESNVAMSIGNGQGGVRVGIGTSSPLSKLHVAGGLVLTNGDGAGFPVGSGGVLRAYYDQADNFGSIWAFDYTAQRSRNLLFNEPGGNIGIGLRAPEVSLDTAGTIRAQGDGYATTGSGLELGMSSGHGLVRPYNRSTGSYLTMDMDAKEYYLSVSGTPRVTIDTIGNVGIGTTNPSQKLDVAGYVKGQSGLCIGNDCRTSWPSGSGGNITGSGSTNYLAKFTGSTSIGNGAIYDNGNVGIGTTSPFSPLHVEGTIASTSPIVRITNNGQGHGILVRTYSTTDKNAAIEAQAMSSSGNTYGVFGITNSTAAAGGSTVGVYGLAQNSRSTGGATLGILGESHSIPDSGSDTSNGVFGWANINDGGSGPNYGRTFGVWGETDSMGPPNGQSGPVSGITGVATNSSMDSLSHGVVGRAVSASTSSFGVYYQGGLSGVGGITSIIRTNSGPRLIYATQSPEPWVEDYGEAQLKNGYARIKLDPVYLQTVAVDASHPFHVFVTPTGTSSLNGLRVIKDAAGFRVQELNGGKSNGTFDWRIAAKRKDLADRRLDISEGAYSDPTLYPERFPNAKLTHEDFLAP